jgi:drug/metabolite transporter (DMT)-like permease
MKSSALGGVLTILFAALCWGIGNAVTGLTAHEYLSSGSMLPAVDIALANTIGGLAFVSVALLLNTAITSKSSVKAGLKMSEPIPPVLRSKNSLLAGAFKGANTCLFVLSTTYIVATQSLIFESTYILWSLVFGVTLLGRRASFRSALLKALLMLVGVLLVSGQTSLRIQPGYPTLGPIYGLSAGLSYALYLFAWSFVTRDLNSLKSKLVSTGVLLTISTLTILGFSELLSLLLLHMWWTPFINLKTSDVFLQTLNGCLVIGVVYLLLTTGMSALRNAREGANFIAAILLSFSIPFTSLSELTLGKFIPTVSQLFGIFLFMVGFILISISTLERRR